MSEFAEYVLIGGGVASVCAIMGIREKDEAGKIILIRDEESVPYDRPPLSKGFLKNPEVTLDDISSKFDNFYPDNGVDLKLGVRADSINTDLKTVALSDGSAVQYGKLLIATGARATIPDASGTDLERVVLLRTMDDADRIRGMWPRVNHLTIVGTGYLGLELASAATAIGKKVTLLSQDEWPWQAFASRECGAYLKDYLVSKGVELILGEPLKSLELGPKVNGGVTDLVILATGGQPVAELGLSAGLAGDPASGIVVNRLLETSAKDVFACGDCASFEDPFLGTNWNAQHHLHAKWTGTAAGKNMAGANEPYEKVAYFWTDFFDQHMILRGSPVGLTQSKLIGNPSSGNFIELWAGTDGVIRMGLALNHDEPKLDPISDKLDEMIRARRPINEISESDF
ncbi:MAG: FAD/NAD(P)-binding oxidoreductase [Fimbriimonadaceae bacterium]